MWRLLVLLAASWLVVPARAQEAQEQPERTVSVRLDDGREMVGKVLAMDLTMLRIQVGDDVMTIPAEKIRSCRFDDEAKGEAQAAGTPDAAAAPPAAAATAPVAESPVPAATPESKKPTWSGPLADPPDAEALRQVPHDKRLSRWRLRLQALDEAYPWLVPTVPVQWISIGLLLAISLSLIVHLSAAVAGGEAVSLGRSTGLALWYLLSAALQAAAVPVHDLSVVLMLLGNSSVALFLLCSLFGLTRGEALIAFAVQLGCLVICYGVLELVTALLGSTGAIT